MWFASRSVFAVAVLLGIFGAIIWSAPKEDIEFLTPDVYLDDVSTGETRWFSIRIRNNTDTPIFTTSVQGSCSCISDFAQRITIEAESTKEIRGLFDSTGYNRNQLVEKLVYVSFDQGKGLYLIPVRARIRPGVVSKARELTFRLSEDNETATVEGTLTRLSLSREQFAQLEPPKDLDGIHWEFVKEAQDSKSFVGVLKRREFSRRPRPFSISYQNDSGAVEELRIPIAVPSTLLDEVFSPSSYVKMLTKSDALDQRLADTSRMRVRLLDSIGPGWMIDSIITNGESGFEANVVGDKTEFEVHVIDVSKAWLMQETLEVNLVKGNERKVRRFDVVAFLR